VKYDASLSLFETVEVTIYLGKGTHFFFACVDGLSADVTTLVGVTDFCSEISSLKPAYLKADNINLTVKPLDCSLDNAVVQAEPELFGSNCVDFEALSMVKPVVMVNSAFVNFNVTREAVFEDIEFDGNDNFAFYTESPNVGKPIEEFPFQFCEQGFEEDTHHGFTIANKANVDFSYVCVRPSDLTNGVDGSYPTSETSCSESLSNFAKERCSGEPYSSDFYELYEGYMAQRRRVLFNLYAFDEMHTLTKKSPSLTLHRCKFTKFMSG